MPVVSRLRAFAALPALLVAVLLTSLFITTGPASAMTRQQRISYGYNIVRAQQGDPYSYGAAGPNRFDCSGLVYYSFRRAGFGHIPRTSSSQARYANHISRSQMRRGDLVFFYGSRGVYHVGVYAGWRNGHRTIIHAPRPGQRVHLERIWTSHWFGGTLRGI